MSLAPKLLAFGLVILLATPALADLAKWDQARVTEIATQLASACDDFEQALRQAPGVGLETETAAFDLRENARMLRVRSGALAAHLKGGKGHDETRNLYRSLMEVVRDTEQNARRAALGEPAMDAWAKVADLLREVAPYYDPRALDEAS